MVRTIGIHMFRVQKVPLFRVQAMNTSRFLWLNGVAIA